MSKNFRIARTNNSEELRLWRDYKEKRSEFLEISGQVLKEATGKDSKPSFFLSGDSFNLKVSGVSSEDIDESMRKYWRKPKKDNICVWRKNHPMASKLEALKLDGLELESRQFQVLGRNGDQYFFTSGYIFEWQGFLYSRYPEGDYDEKLYDSKIWHEISDNDYVEAKKLYIEKNKSS